MTARRHRPLLYMYVYSPTIHARVLTSACLTCTCTGAPPPRPPPLGLQERMKQERLKAKGGEEEAPPAKPVKFEMSGEYFAYPR